LNAVSTYWNDINISALALRGDCVHIPYIVYEIFDSVVLERKWDSTNLSG
jgi:hypothetical protein